MQGSQILRNPRDPYTAPVKTLRQRGGLPGTGSGIRERCACTSDALGACCARSDSDASRSLLGRLPPRCSQQACWSVLVFPPTHPVIAGGGSLLSAAADVLCQPSSTGRDSRVLKLVGLACLLERVRIPATWHFAFMRSRATPAAQRKQEHSSRH